MKKGILFVALGLFAYTMVSCDPVNGGDDPETTKNYWERSTLTQLQLRGPVKTIKEFYTDTTYNYTTFDENGRIVSDEYVGPYDNSSVSYVYNASGQLVSMGTTTYEYASHGRYVPRGPFHVNMIGLTPNLSVVNNEGGHTNYTFVVDTLFIISTSQYEENVYVDTAKFTYSGKYPVSSRTENVSPTTGNIWGEFIDITYQENGMFDEYSEGFFGTGENAYTSTRTTIYKQDDEFLLIDSYTYVDEYSGQEPSSYTIDYTYNTQKDLIQKIDGGYIEEYSGYVYDSHNNWTSRNYRYKNGETWSDYTEERREITYWE